MRKIWGKKKEPDRVVVTTKEQLKTAVNQKKEHIEIKGDLARKLQWLGLLSPRKIAALTVVLATVTGVATIGVTTVGAPIAIGGATVSLAAVSAAPIIEITGGEMAATILASGVAVALLLSILKGYEVEVKYNGASMCLKRKI